MLWFGGMNHVSITVFIVWHEFTCSERKMEIASYVTVIIFFSGEGEGKRKLDELRTINVWWMLMIPYLFLICILI